MFGILFRTVVVYAGVILAMRLMGKRQLGELQPAELVTTFLISNVASICIEEPELPLLASLLPVFLIAALEILNSSLAWVCPRYATVLFGRPFTVIRNGKLDQQALRTLRISAADVLEALRGDGIFTPEDVAWGVIETNGSLSIAEVDETDGKPMFPILVDCHLYRENLQALGLDEKWLQQALQEKQLTKSQVLVLLTDGKKTLTIKKEPPQKQGGSQ